MYDKNYFSVLTVLQLPLLPKSPFIGSQVAGKILKQYTALGLGNGVHAVNVSEGLRRRILPPRACGRKDASSPSPLLAPPVSILR